MRHLSLHNEQPTTILLIHGALSSPSDFSLVTPYLSEYHLLVPFLHAEVEDSTTAGFTASSMTSALASLIQSHAKNSRAHIVGFSLGASLAIHLVSSHPDVIADSVVLSGITLLNQRLSPGQLQLAPYFFFAQSALPNKLPGWLRERYSRLVLDPASPDWKPGAVDEATSVQTCRHVVTLLSELDLECHGPPPAQTRILVVAATSNNGIFKFPDSVEEAQATLDWAMRGNQRSSGVRVPAGSHPWPLQLPQLFATMVKCWITGKEMPDGIVPL